MVDDEAEVPGTEVVSLVASVVVVVVVVVVDGGGISFFFIIIIVLGEYRNSQIQHTPLASMAPK